MAAPSGISWGSIYGSYGRLGIYSKVTTSGATATVNVQVWFWSKYSVTDDNNTVYYNVGKSITEATTDLGCVTIKHTVASGSGWSTSNQTRLVNKTYTYTMGKSAVTYKVYASFKNVDRVGTMMYDNATFTVPAKPKYTITYNANGGSGAPGSQTKWYGETLTLSSTKPTRTGYDFQGWGITSDDTSVNYAAGASYTSNSAITLYAIWKLKTYSVKYNANGGSGAPATQTKTYGKTLTLSSTKPTRTGYDFQGWATSSSGSVTYSAGAPYTNNAAITLYAVWKAYTYTIKYNANGGSGAPGSQTKTYGVALALSKVIPTRTGYTFKGWGTSASTTTVSYSAGGSYTANPSTNGATVTLYAVWSLNYVAPRITNFKAIRCNESGTASSSGTKYKVQFDWATDKSGPTLTIKRKATGTSTWTTDKTVTLSGTSGTTYVSTILPASSLDVDTSYDISITIADSGGSTAKTGYINSSLYTIDFCEGGKGVAFGKAAELENTVDSAWNMRSRKNIMTGNKIGWLDGKTGTYINEDGVIHLQRSTANDYKPYVGFLLDDSTELGAYIRLNGTTKRLELRANGNGCFVDDDIYADNNIYMNHGTYIHAIDSEGNPKNVIGNSTADHTLIGYGNYTKGTGGLYLYGNPIGFRIVTGAKSVIRLQPYIGPGSNLNVYIRTAGFITNSAKDIYFQVPLMKPLLPGTKVTAATNQGFNLRQNNAYTHGSSASVAVSPSSYIVTTSDYFALTIQATFSTTTNAVNNAPIGISWSGTLIFE